MTLRIFGLLD